jgi:hypothetical protein
MLGKQWLTSKGIITTEIQNLSKHGEILREFRVKIVAKKSKI